MNPQNQVERVLKDIHLFFSRCERCQDDPGMLKVDQQQFVDLLERLNYGIYDLMDRYEQTQISAGETQRAARKQGEQIIEQAQKKADDVYAASLLFTSDAIGGIREVMERMQDSMNDMMRQVKKDLFFQREELQKNESEIRSQLTDLADTQTYLMLLDEISHERAMGKRDLLREREIGRAFARNLAGARSEQPEDYYRRAKAAPGTDEIMDLDAETQTEAAAPEKEEAPVRSAEPVKEEPEIIINRDAAYFKWKEEQEKEASDAPQKQRTKELHADAIRAIEKESGRRDTVIREIRSGAEEPSDPERSTSADIADRETADAAKTELPREEDLLKAVMLDEMELYGEKAGGSEAAPVQTEPAERIRSREPSEFEEGARRHGGVGGRLKDFLLGKDLVDEE